jgi:hypothetical protein
MQNTPRLWIVLIALLMVALTNVIVTQITSWNDVQWAWIAGNTSTELPGSVSPIGVTSINNYPGSREGHSMVIHSALNCLFVFAGYGYNGAMGGGA